MYGKGFPCGSMIKNLPVNGRRHRRQGFDPGSGICPWRRKWQPAPAFLPGKLHGQKSLVGYSEWGHTDRWLSNWACILVYGKMQESGLTEIMTLLCAPAIWGQYPVFSHPEFPQGSPYGMAAVWCLLDSRCFLSWASSGLTSSGWKAIIVDSDDCDILVYW